MSNSFWGDPDIWTCRGCPDGSPVNDDGLCEECRDTYRREYEEHLENLDKKVLLRYELRCNTCQQWETYDRTSHGTCNRCIEKIYRPQGLWCNAHGPMTGKCPICFDQLTLEGV